VVDLNLGKLFEDATTFGILLDTDEEFVDGDAADLVVEVGLEAADVFLAGGHVSSSISGAHR
jgi:hypothetical protein